MGGSSKAQTVGYKYFASLAMVIGNRIESLLAINFDKRGWHTGEQTDLGLTGVDCYINKPKLYGEEEGGVRGNIRVHLGQNDQFPDEWYQQHFSLVSAYPYQSYLVFGAPVDATVSANIGSGIFQSIFDNLSYKQNGFYFGNSGFLKEMMLWPKRVHVKNDGSAQWYDAKAEIGPLNPVVPDNYTDGLAQSGFIKTIAENNVSLNYTESQTLINYNGIDDYIFSSISTGEGVTANDVSKPSFEVIIKNQFIVELTTNGKSNIELVILYKSQNVQISHSPNVKLISSTDEPFFSTSYGFFFTKKTITASSIGGFSFEITANGLVYDLDGGTNPWICILESSISLLKPVSDAISISADINPIHKIREILTDDTAMNKPEADINEDNFIAAADRIYSEGLGISWAITEKSCKEAIDELCEHIEGGVRVNRQTGKYEIILFRDDWYDLNKAYAFDESNIKSLKLDVANSDEIINTLNVTYYDRENIKQSAFNIADVGLVHTVGKENAESIDFPYFMNRRNAEIVANWKLKQLSTPAWTGSFSTGSYDARKINRYDVIKLSWAAKGISNLPVRVTKIGLGDGRDNAVTIDFVEVVPYSSNVTAGIVADAPISSGELPPQPNTSVLFEMPYLEAVQQFSQYEVDNRLAYDNNLSYLMVATKRPQSNSLNAKLYTDSGSGYQQVATVDYCATAELDQDIGYTDSSFAIKNAIQLNEVVIGSLFFIDNELMSIESYDEATSVLTVKRGVLDTVPSKHLSGATLYFYDNYASFDQTQYVQGEVVNAKVLTTTPSGILDLADAPELSLTMQARAIRPYPPANVKINGEYYPSEITGNPTISWVDRNRVQQTGGTILGFFDAGVTIESGVTYQLEVYEIDANGTETAMLNINIGYVNTYTIDIAESLATTVKYRIKINSVRSGYNSYQAFEHVVNSSFSAPYNLIGVYVA